MEIKDYELFIRNAKESIEDCNQKLEYWNGWKEYHQKSIREWEDEIKKLKDE